MRLIWTDDDASGLLSPLKNRFRRKGFEPIVALHSYEEAMNFFKNDNHYAKSAILLDIILPSNTGMVSSYLGVELTRMLIAKGVRRLGFLSVVFENEINDALRQIKEENGLGEEDCKTNFFDKTQIVDDKTFSELVDFLRAEDQKDD